MTGLASAKLSEMSVEAASRSFVVDITIVENANGNLPPRVAASVVAFTAIELSGSDIRENSLRIWNSDESWYESGVNIKLTANDSTSTNNDPKMVMTPGIHNTARLVRFDLLSFFIASNSDQHNRSRS